NVYLAEPVLCLRHPCPVGEVGRGRGGGDLPAGTRVGIAPDVGCAGGRVAHDADPPAAKRLHGVAGVHSVSGTERVVVPPPVQVRVEAVAEVWTEVAAVAVVLPLREGGEADEAALAGWEDGAEARARRCRGAV